jgi:hypothetical protein
MLLKNAKHERFSSIFFNVLNLWFFLKVHKITHLLLKKCGVWFMIDVLNGRPRVQALIIVIPSWICNEHFPKIFHQQSQNYKVSPMECNNIFLSFCLYFEWCMVCFIFILYKLGPKGGCWTHYHVVKLLWHYIFDLYIWSHNLWSQQHKNLL